MSPKVTKLVCPYREVANLSVRAKHHASGEGYSSTDGGYLATIWSYLAISFLTLGYDFRAQTYFRKSIALDNSLNP